MCSNYIPTVLPRQVPHHSRKRESWLPCTFASKMERTQSETSTCARRHGQRSFLRWLLCLLFLPPSFFSPLFSLPVHVRCPFSTFTFVFIDCLVIPSSHLLHSFINLHLRQDGSLDAFQVASGHGHHSGDHGCCFGWYISWPRTGCTMITY